jgi:tripartite-type tricarboxylate transporter receptor subunit TctC
MVRVLGTLVIALAGIAGTLAQEYPAKSVHVIIGATPGSTVDVMSRVVCQKLSEQWGQRVLVESRPGAGGSIASAAVAKSQPDGYTLLWHSNAFAANAALYEKLPYDPLRDFVHVTSVVAQPFVLVVSPATGMRTVADLVAAAKAKPGQFTFASVGNGSATHFAAEKFRLAAGIDATHVPYKGGPEANADVIAGRVTFWFSPIAIALPHIRAGRFIALGVSSARRAVELPDVPTIAESGLPGFEYTFWNGVWAPAGTPVDIVEKLSKDLARALDAPDLRERLASLGAEPMSMTPGQFARFVRSEMDDSARIVKAARISTQ